MKSTNPVFIIAGMLFDGLKAMDNITIADGLKEKTEPLPSRLPEKKTETSSPARIITGCKPNGIQKAKFIPETPFWGTAETLYIPLNELYPFLDKKSLSAFPGVEKTRKARIGKKLKRILKNGFKKCGVN